MTSNSYILSRLPPTDLSLERLKDIVEKKFKPNDSEDYYKNFIIKYILKNRGKMTYIITNIRLLEEKSEMTYCYHDGKNIFEDKELFQLKRLISPFTLKITFRNSYKNINDDKLKKIINDMFIKNYPNEVI